MEQIQYSILLDNNPELRGKFVKGDFSLNIGKDFVISILQIAHEPIYRVSPQEQLWDKNV